ncbi:MAG: MFS transporter [Lachnospiraceae bacterium]|nr:MFS transporter [Lachnospiraceae bacterium]
MTNNYKKIILIMCGLAAASIGICQNTPGVFYAPVSTAFGVLRGTFALHATLTSLGIAVTALFMPRVFKKFSIKTIVIFGTILMVAATAGMSFANHMMTFYVLSIIRGIGAGLCANVSITTIINQWFMKSNGQVTSIALSFSGLAGALCSPLLSTCIENFGWRSAYLLQAGILAFFLLPAVILPFHTSPEDEGLMPYGFVKEETTKKETKPSKPFRFLSVSFLCMSVMTLLSTSITGISQHISGYAQSLGMSAAFGGLLLSVIMVGNIIMKLVIGFISDKKGTVFSCFLMMGLNALALFLIALGGRMMSKPLLLFAAFLYGSVYAIGAVGISLLVKLFFGVENYAAAFSKISFIMSTGGACSLPLIGYLFDFTGAYTPAFYIGIAFHAINATLISIILLRRKQ